jgi:hypothetical protein
MRLKLRREAVCDLFDSNITPDVCSSREIRQPARHDLKPRALMQPRATIRPPTHPCHMLRSIAGLPAERDRVDPRKELLQLLVTERPHVPSAGEPRRWTLWRHLNEKPAKEQEKARSGP